MKINWRFGIERVFPTATLLLAVASLNSTASAASVNLEPSDPLLQEVLQLDGSASFTQAYSEFVGELVSLLEEQGLDTQIVYQVQQALYSPEQGDSATGLNLLQDTLASLSQIKLEGNSDGSTITAVPPVLPQTELEDVFSGIYTFELSPESIANRRRLSSGVVSVPFLQAPIKPALPPTVQSTLTRDLRDLSNQTVNPELKEDPTTQIALAIETELPTVYQLRDVEVQYTELDLTIDIPVIPQVELVTALGSDVRRQLRTQQEQMIEQYRRKVNARQERQQQQIGNGLAQRLEQQQRTYQTQFQPRQSPYAPLRR